MAWVRDWPRTLGKAAKGKGCHMGRCAAEQQMGENYHRRSCEKAMGRRILLRETVCEETVKCECCRKRPCGKQEGKGYYWARVRED